MIVDANFTSIEQLDLGAIKKKLMHRESGENWPSERADAVEKEYKRFLYLMKTFPTESTAPSVDVDTFWHYHILDTQKYAADCEHAFGYFLHHYPYIGMEGRADDEQVHEAAADRMREIYEATFGETYQPAAAYCGIAPPKAAAAYCGIVRPPTAAAAYCGIVRPPTAAAAYCGIVRPPTAAAAYCGISPPKADAAYCGISPPKAEAAYCGISPPKAEAAYCGISPPKAEAAYCAVINPARPAERQTAAL